MKDIISVVIPIFNAEKYLCKCLDSVVAQTYKDLEIILVDDGSYDESGTICDEYAKIDSRIKVIHKKNGGASSARNAGIKVASGQYITFADSDDWLAKDMYGEMYNASITYDADTVVTGYFRVRGNQMRAHFFERDTVYTAEEALALLIQNDWMKNYSWNKLYKRSLYEGVSYPEGEIFEDIPVAYKLFEKSNRVVVLSACKYYYFLHKGSAVTTTTYKDYLDYCMGHQNRYKDLSVRHPELCKLMLERYIAQTLVPLIDRLLQNEEVFWEKDTKKICEIQEFVRDMWKELEAAGAIGRMGMYRLRLFANSEWKKLVFFQKKIWPVYVKIKKHMR